jgi:Protein of unknown function (DUF3159)
VVRGATGAAEHRIGVTEPSVWSILRTGLPGFLREGFLPVVAFYLGLRLSGMAAGILVAAFASTALYAYERAGGREGLLVRLSLAFVAIQALLGLVSHSAVVYLATPVLANAVWGLAFIGSVAVARPLAGTLACAWYPFSREFRESAEFKRVYGIESLVWGAYFMGRSALRLAVLLHGTVGGFVVVAFVTGPPATLALLTWSVWYAIRRFSDDAVDRTVVFASEKT